MKPFLKFLPLLAYLTVTPAFGADAPKVRVLEKFDRIDPKTVLSREVKMKIVNTPDPEHHKVFEVLADFAKPGGWAMVQKKFPEGTVNPKKYSGIRFWARSDSGSSMVVFVGGDKPRPDGKRSAFGGERIKGTETWTEYTVPFAPMKRHGDKFWKDGKQVILEGGDPMDDLDYSTLSRVEFYFPLDGRGTALTSHMLIDGLVLVEK